MKISPFILPSLILIICFSCSSDDDGGTTGNDVQQQFLDAHNKYRSDVGVSDLVWSKDLAISSKNWAESLAINCDLSHSDGAYGENIWMGTTDAFTMKDVVDLWGIEIANYNYSENSCDTGEVCGHYTQIVWANTTEVGCGVASCDGSDVWVCQYLPQGNYIGEKPY
ncbi:MAG: hypothetical protein GY816_07935 [Cytophagales bacterium]|nr:hypothetical protein [Cytophagales bacterium]